MNDFTKEELGIIACFLCVTDKTKDVLKKVVHMYETYCDHEEQYEDFNCQPMRCKKCLEIIG